MRKNKNQLFGLMAASHLFMASILLSGCAQPADVEKPVENLPVVIVQEVTPDPLSVYSSSLIEHYDGDIDELANAPRYFIDIDISDEVNLINGYLEVAYTNQTNSELEDIYFRLIPNFGGQFLNVLDVHVNGDAVLSELEKQNTALRVPLPQLLMPNEDIHISMSFSLQVPTEMGGNYGLFIYQEDILALDSFFPIIPAASETGWLVNDLPPNADMIYTEAAFFTVSVSAPRNLVLVTSGVEVDAKEEDGRQVNTYAGGPQRDFYIAASPRFSKISMQIGETMVNSYFPEEYRDMGERILMNASKALIYFSERYGYYPYVEMDLVSTPMQAGGMEYSGVAALALHLYQSEDLTTGEPGTIFLESATAHELAHQWFFNQVMNNPQIEPWLDEGFAQYLTYIYYLDNYGQEAAERFIDSWHGRWLRVDKEPIPIGKPADAYSGIEYSAIVYGRAPIFLLELERLMGAEVFGDFLKEYVNTYRWQIVDADKFKKLAEKFCNCDLTGMFEEWVWWNKGIPEIEE